MTTPVPSSLVDAVFAAMELWPGDSVPRDVPSTRRKDKGKILRITAFHAKCDFETRAKVADIIARYVADRMEERVESGSDP